MTQLDPIGFPSNVVAIQTTIAASASISEMIPTQGMALVAIIMPGTWTAAALAFKVCTSGNKTDLQFLYNNAGGAERSLAAASETILFPVPDASFFPWLQVVSVDATAGSVTPVNQNAARTLVLLFRKYLS
jgi:hypothetical protein